MKVLKSIKLLLLFVVFFLLSDSTILGQEDGIKIVVDETPVFGNCISKGYEEDDIRICSDKNLLEFVYGNVMYPDSARAAGVEGRVVVRFVVEKDGSVGEIEAVKDIGHGCGAEVERVIGAINDVGLKWRPAKINGEAVRYRYNLPVTFKLEDVADFVLMGRDSVYLKLDDGVKYEGGSAEFSKFIMENLESPIIYTDSCYVGYMDVSLYVGPNGGLRVINVNDYNDLGLDFQFQVIKVVTATEGNWIPGRFQGRAVGGLTEVRVPLKNDSLACDEVVEQYKKAEQLAFEGSQLFNEGKQEEGMEKLNMAIELYPRNADFLYMRGQAFLQLEDIESACKDYSEVRRILTNSPVESVYHILCPN